MPVYRKWSDLPIQDTGHEGTMTSRILLVEDSPLIQRLIALCLGPLEVDLEVRSDGVAGLAAVFDAEPDMLILDIGLPGMSGWEILDALRSNVKTRHLPVLVLTAHAGEENKERARTGGADHFMTKPFHNETLRTVVRQLLARSADRASAQAPS